MTTMHPCERVDVSFAETARFRFTNTVELAVTLGSCSKCLPARNPGRAGPARSPTSRGPVSSLEGWAGHAGR
jgi:hypothetical protein